MQCLARAMLAQGNAPGAKKEIEGNRVMALRSQNRLARFNFDLALANVLLASDQPDLSREELERTRREARDLGFAGIELEARLALAELDKHLGRAATAKTELKSLQSAAHAKGFELIARKAAAAL